MHRMAKRRQTNRKENRDRQDKERKREWYHSVLLVRGDGEELWWVRHRRVLDRLSGGLDRPEGLKKQQTREKTGGGEERGKWV